MCCFKPGTKVKIVRSAYAALLGRIVIVCTYQDCPDKIRVSYDDKWQGYFTPTQLREVHED